MRSVTRCALALVALAASGCAAPTRAPGVEIAPDPLAGIPLDLSVDLMVRGPEPRLGATGAVEPCHITLFCDGSLHWAGGPTFTGGLPPLRRVVGAADVEEVWKFMQLLRPTGGARDAVCLDLLDVAQAPGQADVLGVFTAQGSRWSVLERWAGDGAPGTAMAELLATLSRLAWADQERTPAAPPPENFGPDPYARYRR